MVAKAYAAVLEMVRILKNKLSRVSVNYYFMNKLFCKFTHFLYRYIQPTPILVMHLHVEQHKASTKAVFWL